MEPGEGLACVAAPQGLDPDAPLLVGLIDGGVLRIRIFCRPGRFHHQCDETAKRRPFGEEVVFI